VPLPRCPRRPSHRRRASPQGLPLPCARRLFASLRARQRTNDQKEVNPFCVRCCCCLATALFSCGHMQGLTVAPRTSESS
jgi:hypothetical protein